METDKIKETKKKIRETKKELAKVEAKISAIKEVMGKDGHSSTISLLGMVQNLNPISAINYATSSSVGSKYQKEIDDLTRERQHLSSELFYLEMSLPKKERINIEDERVNKDQTEIDKLRWKALNEEKLLAKYEGEKAGVKAQIEELEKIREDASTLATTSLLSMISGASPLSAVDYAGNYLTRAECTSKLSKLEKQASPCSYNVVRTKNELDRIERRIEYLERDEAKLIVDNGCIYIDGDETKTDVLGLVKKTINDFYSEFDELKNHRDVKDYKENKAKIDKKVKDKNIPKMAEKDIKLFEEWVKCPFAYNFRYTIINGKVFVNQDFLRGLIDNNNRIIEIYQKSNLYLQGQIDNFSPSLLGKIIKSVGEKQKHTFKANIKSKIERNNQHIEVSQRENNKYIEFRDKYILPVKDCFVSTANIIYYAEKSDYVKKYLQREAVRDSIIKNKTILKSSRLYKNTDLEPIVERVDRVIPLEVVKILDQKCLKISEQSFMETLLNNKELSEYAIEVCNLKGYEQGKTNDNQKNNSAIKDKPEQYGREL